MSDQQIKAPQPAPDQEAEKNNAIVGKKLQSIFRQVKTLYALQYTKTDKYPNEIIPHLYLGSVGAALSKDVMIELKIKYVLTAMDEMKQPFPDIINEYKIIRVKDSKTEPISTYFDESNEFINKAISQGENILVHCFAGVSRSATFVIAYIMKYCKKSFEEALKIAKDSRSVVNPNPSFVQQLKKYEEVLKQSQEEVNNDTNIDGDNKNVEKEEIVEQTDNKAQEMIGNSKEQNEQNDEQKDKATEIKDTLGSQLDENQREGQTIQQEEIIKQNETQETDVSEQGKEKNIEEQGGESVVASEVTEASLNQQKDEEEKQQTNVDSKSTEENTKKDEESDIKKEEISQINQPIDSNQVEATSNNNEGEIVESKALEEQTGEKGEKNEADNNQGDKDNQNEEEKKTMEQSEEGVAAEKDQEVGKKKKNQKKRRR